MGKILSPKGDIVFHMLFGEQNHEGITKKLIEDVIGEKVETIELEQTPYLWGERVKDKVGIIDIKAKINNKNPIDIEMQIADNKNIEKRILFYWSKLYLKQLKEGEQYNKLSRSISIIFLDYKIEKLKELPIHTKWQIKESEKGKEILIEDLEIHIIELAKMKEKEEEGRLKKWILFLEDPEGEETKKMAEKEKEIKEAIEALEEISNDEEKVRIAELREKYIADRESELETAEEKGITKGIAKEKLETAKKMKEKNMKIEDIIEITGLSREEIENI